MFTNEEADTLLGKEINRLTTENEQLWERIFILEKTIEGIQNLFIRAGEYKGKSRGRLPR